MQLNAHAHADLRRFAYEARKAPLSAASGLTGLTLIFALGLLPTTADAIIIQESAENNDPTIGTNQFDSGNFFSSSGAVYFFNDEGETLGQCSATVIDSRTVITAGHCLSDEAASGEEETWVSFVPNVFQDSDSIDESDVPFKRVNAPDIGLVGGSRAISVIRHPDYDNTLSETGDIGSSFVGSEAQDYDIAILTLEDAFVGENLGRDRFAVLPDSQVETGQQVYIVGYGLNGQGLSVTTNSGVKFYATNTIDELEQLDTSEVQILKSDFDPLDGFLILDDDFQDYLDLINIGEGQAIQNEGSTSLGDSGGGMFILNEETGELTLVGVASGIQVRNSNDISTYGEYGTIMSHSNVFEYLDFINSQKSYREVAPRSGDRRFGSVTTWADGVVPENSSTTDFDNDAKFYEVQLTERGTLTVDATHTIDRMLIDGTDNDVTPVLNVDADGFLTADVEVDVVKGKVVVDGRINAYRFIIGDGTTVEGSGLIDIEDTGFLFNDDGGRLDSTTPGTFLTVDGLYRQKPDATLGVIINDGGNGTTTGVAGLAVDGRAKLRGTLDITFEEGFDPAEGESWTVLTFEDINGEFDNVTSNYGPFFDIETTITDDSIIAEITRAITPTEVSETPNQLAVGNALFELRGSADEEIQVILDELSSLDEDEFGEAFEQLSPEVALQQRDLAHRSIGLFGNQLTNRSRQIRLNGMDRLFLDGKTIRETAWAPTRDVVQVASMDGVAGLLDDGGAASSLPTVEYQSEARGFMGYADAPGSSRSYADASTAQGNVYSDYSGYAQPQVQQQRSAAASNARSRRGRYARFGAAPSAARPTAAPAVDVSRARVDVQDVVWQSAFYDISATEVRRGFEVAEVKLEANHTMALSGGEGLTAANLYGADDAVTTDAPEAVMQRRRGVSRYAQHMQEVREHGTVANDEHLSNRQKMGEPGTAMSGAYFHSNPYVEYDPAERPNTRYPELAKSAYTMPDDPEAASSGYEVLGDAGSTAPPRPVREKRRAASRWSHQTKAALEDNVNAKEGSRGARIKNGISVWTSGDFFIGENDISTAITNNSYAGGVLTFGADYSFSEQMVFGAAATIVTASAEQSVGDTSADGVIGAVYGGITPTRGLSIDAYAALGGLKYVTDRSATVGALTENLDGETDGLLYGAGITAAYKMTNGDFEFGPVAGMNFNHVTIDGYTESGTTLAMQVADQEQGRLRFSFGGEARYNWDVDRMVILPRVKATWEQQFITGDTDLAAAFAVDPSVGYTVSGNEEDGGWLALESGVDLQFSQRTTGYVSYGADLFKEDDFSHNFSAGLRVAF